MQGFLASGRAQMLGDNIRPFRFLLKLLCDERLEDYLSQEEIGRVAAVEADNEDSGTYEKVVSRILECREDGIAYLMSTEKNRSPEISRHSGLKMVK